MVTFGLAWYQAITMRTWLADVTSLSRKLPGHKRKRWQLVHAYPMHGACWI